jgi:hypothetical protein
MEIVEFWEKASLPDLLERTERFGGENAGYGF